eukprot:scaffold869_cov303-Pinguiococcus_pyrenoidosus.AAC.4
MALWRLPKALSAVRRRAFAVAEDAACHQEGCLRLSCTRWPHNGQDQRGFPLPEGQSAHDGVLRHLLAHDSLVQRRLHGLHVVAGYSAGLQHAQGIGGQGRGGRNRPAAALVQQLKHRGHRLVVIWRIRRRPGGAIDMRRVYSKSNRYGGEASQRTASLHGAGHTPYPQLFRALLPCEGNPRGSNPSGGLVIVLAKATTKSIYIQHKFKAFTPASIL